MLRFLDAFLVLAVMINLIKGAELILRPHQEKWLKSKLESLTLWLDYTRPIEWYMKSPATVYLVSNSLLFFTSSFVFLKRINYWGHGTLSILFHSLMLTMLLDMFRFGFELRPAKDKTTFQVESELREGKLKAWLWRSPTILNSLARQMTLAIAGLLTVVAFIAFVPLLLFIWVSLKNSPLALVPVLTVVFLAIVYRKKILVVLLPLGNVGSFAAFNIILTVLIISAEWTLKLLRAFLWRVVEYNRGPVAAFTLVITVLLGTAEVYFRLVYK